MARKLLFLQLRRGLETMPSRRVKNNTVPCLNVYVLRYVIMAVIGTSVFKSVTTISSKNDGTIRGYSISAKILVMFCIFYGCVSSDQSTKTKKKRIEATNNSCAADSFKIFFFLPQQLIFVRKYEHYYLGAQFTTYIYSSDDSVIELNISIVKDEGRYTPVEFLPTELHNMFRAVLKPDTGGYRYGFMDTVNEYSYIRISDFYMAGNLRKDDLSTSYMNRIVMFELTNKAFLSNDTAEYNLLRDSVFKTLVLVEK